MLEECSSDSGSSYWLKVLKLIYIKVIIDYAMKT